MKSRMEPGSFRDPSGFIFYRDNTVYRQINKRYANNFDHLVQSGLYRELSEKGLLIRHEIVQIPPEDPDTAYLVIQPERVPFISYPYEWSFSQLRDAALITLQIQKIALDYGMILKDASAFNIQFLEGKPVFIDTLSFEIYKEGSPWIAYRQFCEHFLGPLLLIHYCDMRLNRFSQLYLGAIPIDLVSRLLPGHTWFSIRPLIHIHLHAKSQSKYADSDKPATTHNVSKNGILGLIGSLEHAVEKCKWEGKGTEWVDYYDDNNYSPTSFAHKKEQISNYIKEMKPGMIWDLGANTGEFSRLGDDHSASVVAFDIDFGCVNRMYLDFRKEERFITPVFMDLCTPSPNIGWNLKERKDIKSRGPGDMVMALALIHHLRITGNVPIEQILEYLSHIARSVIIEFIPKNDSQVRRMLMNREDIFDDYSLESFEACIPRYFKVIHKDQIPDSTRVLYLLTNLIEL